jgi:hypothetical protein
LPSGEKATESTGDVCVPMRVINYACRHPTVFELSANHADLSQLAVYLGNQPVHFKPCADDAFGDLLAQAQRFHTHRAASHATLALRQIVESFDERNDLDRARDLFRAGRQLRSLRRCAPAESAASRAVSPAGNDCPQVSGAVIKQMKTTESNE